MNRSLQRHLSLVLAGAILLAGLVAAIGSFGLAYLEAKEFQDDMLRQIATLDIGTPGELSRQRRGSDSELVDPESRITVIHLPHDQRPEWLNAEAASGFHTVSAGASRMRAFVRDAPAGERTVVAQPTDARDEIAINSALRTLVPLLLLLPVLALLTIRIVRRELAPIAHLSGSLDDQAADRPQPIADAGLPTEIIPFVQAINRLLERVNHLMGQQRRFIADAAHELRSPLAALSLQAHNLRQSRSLEMVNERVVPLQAGIERARQLTDQLLNLARTQTEPALITSVNISSMARELVAEYLPLAEAKGIDLGLEERAPITARTSPEVLRLILKNAIENALKYTPNGGQVTLRLVPNITSLAIEVVDDGPGIPESEREHVLEAFYRMPETPGEGSGLGLAIAREAAIRIGGVVSLHGRHIGHGLVFRYKQNLDA